MMNELVADLNSERLRIALLGGAGVVLAAGVFAWLQSRRGESKLGDRTRMRLAPPGRRVPDAVEGTAAR